MTRESKKKWVFPEELPENLKKEFTDLSPLERLMLYSRGIKTKSDIDEFFNLDISSVPNWDKLHDVNSAVLLIENAVKKNKKIFIHGDFDADGVCATAIIWEFLYKELPEKLKKKVDVTPYIPDRVDEGYGLTEKSINAMIDQGAEVIITVDCGIRDRAIIEKYKKKGELDFIVTDHHLAPDDAFDNIQHIVVHPKYKNHEYPNEKICGTTVSFLLTQGLRAKFGFDSEITKDTQGLDLVALATVTDLMPIIGINRVLVKYGLEQINHSKRIGMQALIQSAGIKYGDIDSYHLGYVIGPRINAAGRLDKAIEALRLFVTDNLEYAKQIADKLNEINLTRQKLTNEILINSKSLVVPSDKLIFIYGEGWPEGVIGLVAGKLQEEFGKPTIVVTKGENDTRGSARSLPGFDITDAISQFSDYLERFGGHSEAAGFTVKEGAIEEFKNKLLEYSNTNIKSDLIGKSLFIDAIANQDAFNLSTLSSLAKFKPYGIGNRKPMFVIEEAVVAEKRIMGTSGNHLKLTLKGKDIDYTEGIMFDSAEDITKINIDDTLDFAGYLDENEWNGNKTIQFQVREWKRANL